MSRRNNGGGANGIYMNPLFGWNPMQSNPGADRERQIGSVLGRAISELAINRFKWEGFPSSVDTRFLEVCLLWQGLAVGYWNKDYNKFLVVRGAPNGSINMLNNPIAFNVFGPGTPGKPDQDATVTAAFMNKTIGAYQPAIEYDGEKAKEKAIPIWSNALRYPDFDIIQLYATKIAATDHSIEINSRNARRQKVLILPPNAQLSGVNIAREIDEGNNVIQISNSAILSDMSWLQAIDLGITPDSYEKLALLRSRMWNECMGLLGIDNSNQDKKERLVSDEVGANDAQTDSMRFVSLNARRQAAGYIKDVFGYDVQVDFNVEVEARAQEIAAQQGLDKEGE